MLSCDVLVPVRFLSTIGQLLGIITVLLDKEPHLLASLPARYAKSEYQDAETEFLRLLGFALVFLLLELASLMSGLTFFNNRSNAWHCGLHGFGALAVLAFYMFYANFRWFWHIFWVASIAPVCLEILTLMNTYWLGHAAF
eukprot:TRINITY_DN13442_c0_g1_i2.p1 TRINITY_DN13442_c0_g1~~TRINITY_DN13442_c0_g1_i2.p1  ORF type:complete len:141 (-),score=28.84 TRINITY_DN13442_c0_g1_i2:1397-1819(-)